VKRLIAAVSILIVLLLALVFFAERWLANWGKEAQFIGQAQVVQLTRGMPLTKFAETLSNSGVISSKNAFIVWVKVNGDYSRFQAGNYRFHGDVTPQQIAEDVTVGRTFDPVLFEVTIPEGFTAKKLLARLATLGFQDPNDVAALFKDRVFLEQLKIPSNSIEGFLFPATYSFTEYPDARALLTKIVSTFWERLPPGYVEQAKERGLTLAQAVTFASLIELESAQPEERPKIAEVIWNRLNRGMTLGIDAAIIYGAQDYYGDLTWAHLRDAKNPFNTRLQPGLPPSPIGSPSVESLAAVLQPTNEGWFYYVARPEGGSHFFSRSLVEHNRGVAELRRAERSRR